MYIHEIVLDVSPRNTINMRRGSAPSLAAVGSKAVFQREQIQKSRGDETRRMHVVEVEL